MLNQACRFILPRFWLLLYSPSLSLTHTHIRTHFRFILLFFAAICCNTLSIFQIACFITIHFCNQPHLYYNVYFTCCVIHFIDWWVWMVPHSMSRIIIMNNVQCITMQSNSNSAISNSGGDGGGSGSKKY